MDRKQLVPLFLALALLFLATAEPSAACQSVIQLDQTTNGSWVSSCTSLHRSGRYARYYVFTLTTPTTVQIDLTSSVDPYLYLLEDNGSTVLAQDDDGGGNRNARITRSLEPGTYVIEATTDSTRRTGPFTLSLRGGNCLTSIPLNQSVNGSWSSGCASTHRGGRYARYYTFTLTSATPMQIDLSSATSTRDPYLFLLSGNGTGGQVIASDDDSGDGDSARISRTLGPGTYTVEATTFGAAQTGSFTLTVRTSGGGGSCSSTTTPEAVVVDNWTGACASTHRSGSSARYYTFTLTAPKAMVVLLSSSTADPYLYLLEGSGPNGVVIKEDGVEPGKAAVLAFLRPGTYTVEAATRDSDETGSFTLTLVPFF